MVLAVCCQISNEGVELIVACGRNCTTDLIRARTSLAEGRFAEALEEYSCANTPEAAFGAGLTQTLLSLEHPSADGLMALLGLPPFVAGDLAGPRSAMVRFADHWRGHVSGATP
jgi:hypothetical protein